MIDLALANLVPLGATPVQITPLGTGTWAWGDRFVWGYGGGSYNDSDLREAFRVTLQMGINWFDTAEVYGFGRSETLLGQFIPESGQQAVIATKLMPLPWRLRPSGTVAALRHSLQRLRLDRVDLYQVHWPLPPIEMWMAGLAEAVEAGLTRAVGVSNYDVEQTRRAYTALKARGVPLASNQVEYSLLHREPERNGLLQYCREQNIMVIAYSPIAKGILTGKYTPEHTPPGRRGQGYNRSYLTRVQPLLQLLNKIGDAHGKSMTQVALNWVLCKGAVAIPGAKNLRQAQENAGGQGWRLDEGEVLELDRVSERVGG